MRIGLLADTHDRVPAVAELVRRMQEMGVYMVLHAGDYCSPFSLAPILDAQLPLVGVFGRNDGDHEGLRAKAAQGMGMELYDGPHSFELGGKRVMLVHELGDINSRSIDGHQIVVHGCSHSVEMKTRGDTHIVNPGEACGWLYGSPSAAVLDLATGRIEVVKLTESEWRS
jgi:putative phosphoesterase